MNQPSRLSFTPQHQLEDAEQEYIDSVYRFRQAEEEKSADYTSTKLEMIRLEAKLRAIREHIYRGTTCELFNSPKAMNQFSGCPKPAWT